MEIIPTQLDVLVRLESWYAGMNGCKEYGYDPSKTDSSLEASIHRVFTTHTEAVTALSECKDFVESDPCDPTDPESPPTFTREVRFRIQKGVHVPSSERMVYEGTESNQYFNSMWDSAR